jgi:predicted Zn-dependent protease with MMP-like domain
MLLEISAHTRTISLIVYVAVLLSGLLWWFNRNAKKSLEENGRLQPKPNSLDLTLGLQPQRKPIQLKYSEQEFRDMISKVLDELPRKFDKEWKNVAIIHSTEWPTDLEKKRMGVPEGSVVCGTYFGHDRTVGTASGHSPHVITIYQPALELRCGSDKVRLEREIRRTVLHELAHHLGMSHTRMREIGL